MILQIQKQSICEQIYNYLVKEITEGRYRPGSRLPALRQLASALGVSQFPVQQAVQRLADEGYVEKRRGSGCVVVDTAPMLTMADTVALCLHTHEHVYSELTRLLTTRLQRDRYCLQIVDLHAADSLQYMQQLARSGCRTFVVQGGKHVSHNIFATPALAQARIIALLEWWCEPLENQVQILTDGAAGGEMVADYLWERGHRHVACVSVDKEAFVAGNCGEPQRRFRHGEAFARRWRELGGTMTTLPRRGGDGEHGVEPPVLDRLLKLTPPVTAIHGFRDVDTYGVQRQLAERAPEASESIEFIGYYDTPWCRLASPPFASVSLNLPAVADAVAHVLQQVRDNDEIGFRRQWVTPQLKTVDNPVTATTDKDVEYESVISNR